MIKSCSREIPLNVSQENNHDYKSKVTEEEHTIKREFCFIKTVMPFETNSFRLITHCKYMYYQGRYFFYTLHFISQHLQSITLNLCLCYLPTDIHGDMNRNTTYYKFQIYYGYKFTNDSKISLDNSFTNCFP